MSFNTIADAVSTCHLVSAIKFSMSRSGFGAMLSAVYGFKIKSCLFDGIHSIEDWIVDQMHIADQIDLSCFWGNLRHDDLDNARECWKLSDGNNFRVRSKHFCYDKTKIPAGKHLMDLVAVDWFKDTKRMDHVARQLVTGSLLRRFVDGDDEFCNSRLKVIPSVPKGSWIVRQSVGSTTCLLGKADDCNYLHGPKCVEVNALGISLVHEMFPFQIVSDTIDMV
ncbi:hypothetical protein WN943_006983 [Citrus x changshan-huyou]